MRNHLLVIGAATVLLAGCKSTKPDATAPQPVVETIGTKPVYTSEFQYVYNKNNANAENAYSKASLDEYLNLYTNFRLKVMEAEARGLDTSAAFRRELEGYKQQLAQPYLTEKSVTDKLVREAYDRMKKEINASHILVNVSPDAEPKDTLAAYNRIVALRKRALAGEDFGGLAFENSEDPSARENRGNLGYFTALQMVYPFEDAAYKTPKGQISNPVRTRFGYHILKVNDVRDAQGEIKVAHIMVRATPNMPKADSAEAKRKVDEIYKRVQKKEDWDKLAAQFSEDAGSANNGGDLPWFGTGRMIPSFEEAAFKLAKPGDISAPVQTPYGWHIIKLEEKRGLPTYEESEAMLRSKVAKDSRSELNKAAFLKRIRTENKFTEFKGGKELVMSKADSSVVKGTFKYSAGPKDKTGETPLFQIQDKKYNAKDFFTFVESNQQPRKGANPQHYMQSLYDQYVENSLVNYEKNNLESKYIDYKMLVKEYRDGILLFQLMDEKVWSKAIEDTTGLQKYFDLNKEKYKWDTRAEATVISASSKELLTKAEKMLATGRFENKKMEPKTLSFEAGKDAFTKLTQMHLDNLISELKSDSTMQVVLSGSATAKEAAKNKKLAQTRADKVVLYLTSKDIAKNRLKTVASGKGKAASAVNLSYTSADPAVLESTLNEGNPLGVQIMHKKFQKGENKALDGVTWQPGTYNVERDGRFMQIRIERILPPTYKTLNEARGLATSDYQAYLEKQWIEDLRQKNPVKVNQPELDKLVKK